MPKHFTVTSFKLLMAAIAGLFIVVGPAASQQVRVGIAATVTGDVKFSNKAVTKPKKVQRRQRLSWGDTMRTGGKSKLQMLLLDRSTMTMGSNSRLTIDRFVYDPNGGRSFSSTIAKGAFRFMSGKREENSGGQFNSPSGSIGIRGTAVDFIVGGRAVDLAKEEEGVPRGTDHDKDTAMFVVLRGPGPNAVGNVAPGAVDVTGATQTVTLDEPSLAAYVPYAGAEPIGPFRISPAGLSNVQDLISNNVWRANKGGFLDDLLPVLGVAAGIAVGAIILSGNDDDPNLTATEPTNPTSGGDYCQQYPDSPDCGNRID